eukprot:152407_1
MPYGKGTLTGQTGDKYAGNFDENYKYSGHGTFTWVTGSAVKYVGEFENNMRSGKGTCTFKNGDTYVGNWANDKQNGQGKMTYRVVYRSAEDGMWKDNKFQGIK